jgi:hypothetical protein
MCKPVALPLIAAALSVAIVACGDVTSPRASLPTFSDTATVYALNGAPPGAPTALSVFGEIVLPADPTFRFDIAFDLDANGRVLLMPVRTVANGLATTHSVGLQTVTTLFDSTTEAPKSGYRRDSTMIINPGTTVVIESADPAACGTSFIASTIYAKLVVEEVNVANRRMRARFVVDPNCGFRSFAAGVPDWLK